MIKLGSIVKDKITKFKGVATARAEYLDGCIKYLVEEQKVVDGVITEFWFDEQRITNTPEAKSGGPKTVPKNTKRL